MLFQRWIAFSFLALFLSGCSGFDGFLSDDKLPPLKGTRVSILAREKALSPDLSLQQTPLSLPDPWANQFWPQAGGYPGHAMGHLALGDKLERAWSVSIGEGGGRRHPLIAQPIVAGGKVFTLDADVFVTAFDLKTGKRLWRAWSIVKGEENAGAIGGGIAYAGGKIFVANGYKNVICMNAETGAVLWRSLVSSPVRAAPSVMDDRVFILTLDNKLEVLSAADGTPLWSYSGVAETTNILGAAAPAVDKTIVVLPMSSGELLGLRVENGQIVWEDNLSSVHRAGALGAIADIRALPVMDNGLVFAVSYSGRTVALDPVTGRRVWQQDIAGAETPWSAGDALFMIAAGQEMIALSKKTGGIYWLSPLSSEAEDVFTGPVLAGGRLIVASNDGEIREINPADGSTLATHDAGGSIIIPPVVADQTLLVLTNGGKLVAYR